MTMGRRDFEAIAQAIKVCVESTSGNSNRQLIADMTKAIASHASRTNGNFNLFKFYAACGWEDYEIGRLGMF